MKAFVRKLMPGFLLSWYHLALAMAGVFWYRFPSRNLVVVGITGTNGKSTVVNLATRIFEEALRQAQGKPAKTASLSSIRFKIGDKEWPNTLKMTMPGRFKLQKFLRDAVDAGCTHAVLEVTSEGIKQWRHWGIDFDVAVLTNVTPEHIESHGSFEKYREAKAKLFQSLAKHKTQITNSKPRTRDFVTVRGKQNTKHKSQISNRLTSIVNLDDENAEYFLQFDADEKYGYGIGDEKSHSKVQNVTKTLYPERYTLSSGGVEFTVDGTTFSLKLHGLFNVYNALAAICVGLSQGVDMETIKRVLEKIEGVPGRFEIVQEKPFTVIVDYAHTPDALENVYKTARSLNPKPYTLNPSLICVLGAAGGGRDKWKRPELGKIAARYCDKIVLTDEDPYDENPNSILNEIESGFSKAPNNKKQIPNYMRILDRREAIRKALSMAREGDAVVITGKGSEPWMMIAGGKRVPWDDREVVKEELQNSNK